jgi:lactate dehydrogenase-like 2-hydroxyacid dehydrogenase
MDITLLVVESVYRKGEAEFRAAKGFTIEPAPALEEPLAAAIRNRSARAVIVGAAHYAGPLYEALVANGRDTRGALIARFGVGHDGIDKAQARRHGIVVTNTPGVLNASVAEHTIWLMGNLARHIGDLEAQFRRGNFSDRQGRELHGKRLGILGFGGIGRCVASIAHFGLGMTVLAAGASSQEAIERREQRPLAEILSAHGASEYTTDLDAVISQADFLSLHLPAVAETRHIINAARLARMKPDALLINTARGAVLDESALYDCLAAGRIAGAALDVFETEPYAPASPGRDLRTLENVVLTPHAGSNTREANRRMALACMANVANFFAGRLDALARVDRAG